MKNWLVENVEDNHHWINRFAEMIRRREPLAEDVIGFMDGLSLTSECSPDDLTQNAYYLDIIRMQW
jgi:hypothetical protein